MNDTFKSIHLEYNPTNAQDPDAVTGTFRVTFPAQDGRKGLHVTLLASCKQAAASVACMSLGYDVFWAEFSTKRIGGK